MSDFDLGGKYDIGGVLGRGAMGTVYDARDPRIDRRVAIKTVRRAGDDDEEAAEALARFRQEARAAGRLVHPHIVGVYDFGETEDYAYIVMEFVEGRTLKARLDEAGRLAPAEALHIMLQVLSGLAYSHARGVIHRDIKPANIILAIDGEAKIADFGVARLENSDMTSVGTMIGTPSYMAPEQFLGEGVDARSDLYAAGVTLFHMLTGEKPYDGGMTAIMHRVLKTEEPPPRAAERRADIPPLLDAAVAKAMAKRAADRFEDAAAFTLALRVALAAPDPDPAPADEDATVFGRTATSPPVPAEVTPKEVASAIPAAAARRRSRLALPGLVALALIAAAGGAWFVSGGGAPPSQPAPAPARPAPAPAQAAVQVPAAPVERPAGPVTQVRRAVAAILAVRDCVAATVDPAEGDGIAVHAVGTQRSTAAAHDLAQAAAAGLRLDWVADTFDGPYCPTVNLVRNGMTDGAIAVGLAGGAAVLRDGDDILPQATVPGFAAYMRIDYFAHDGTVAHFYPRGAAAPLAPGTLLRLAAADTGVAGQPYGTDMILGIASSSPLPRRGSLVEPAAAYLPALRAAIDALRGRGGHVAGGVATVRTMAR